MLLQLHLDLCLLLLRLALFVPTHSLIFHGEPTGLGARLLLCRAQLLLLREFLRFGEVDHLSRDGALVDLLERLCAAFCSTITINR